MKQGRDLCYCPGRDSIEIDVDHVAGIRAFLFDPRAGSCLRGIGYPSRSGKSISGWDDTEYDICLCKQALI